LTALAENGKQRYQEYVHVAKLGKALAPSPTSSPAGAAVLAWAAIAAAIASC
jgi:hypothetical protein